MFETPKMGNLGERNAHHGQFSYSKVIKAPNMLLHGAGASSAHSLRVFSPRRAISTLVALGRGLEEVYSVPQTLPDSIARALARLESATKTNPAHGINERPSGEGVANSRGQEE
jgi:hypothetical protein